MTTDRIWVLGAPDPEMEIIERLLRECGERVEYAMVTRNGERRRVMPSEAYAPDVEIGSGLRGLNSTAYMVECAPYVLAGPSIDWTGVAITIDHHRPGDPGYGRPPAEFMAASSIGQVVAELARLDLWPPPGDGCGRDWTPTNCRPMWFGESYEDPHGDGGWWIVGEDSGGCCHRLPYAFVPYDLVLCAAADHCLAHAYRGECPGVDPDDLMMQWRAATRAAHQGRPAEDVLDDVGAARAALRAAPRIDLGEGSVCDMRGDLVPELPEAAAREGAAYLATVVERDGREKVVLGGHTTPEVVRAFMLEWAPANGLVGAYGDPARGFAGGYMPE